MGVAQAFRPIVRAVRTRVFTASGTYTPDPNLLYADIEAVGGGGAGGGVTGSASTTRGGGGGASGSYARAMKTAAQIGASQTVTIAAAAVGASGANGANGGDCSVGTLCVGKGAGGGSVHDGSTGFGAGGTRAVAGTGDITPTGNDGGFGCNGLSAGDAVAVGGHGAGSIFGGGARADQAAGAASAGRAAGNYGGGGSGAQARDNVSSAAGGNGAPGVVIVTEYCSQ
jgi:hypothetical protein